MPYLEMEEESIYYEHRGSGNDPVLLLIHGSGGDHNHWPEALRGLSGYNVYAVDLPGHGKSSGRGRKSVEAYGDLVEDFVRRKGLSGVVLFGHSLGGAIAQTLGLKKPDWLSRLVLVGTGARLRVAPEILSGVEADFEKTCGMIMEWAYGPDAPAALVEEGRAVIAKCLPETLHGDFSACDGFDIMDRVHGIEIPALVVAADADKLTPLPYAKYLCEKIPIARLALVYGAGHMMALEAPEQFMDGVKAFLETRSMEAPPVA